MNLLEEIIGAKVVKVYPFPSYTCREKDTACYARAIILETKDGETIVLTPNTYDETIVVEKKILLS